MFGSLKVGMYICIVKQIKTINYGFKRVKRESI